MKILAILSILVGAQSFAATPAAVTAAAKQMKRDSVKTEVSAQSPFKIDLSVRLVNYDHMLNITVDEWVTVKTAKSKSSSLAGARSEALDMKRNDVMTSITKVRNTEGNPCLPAGVSYNVDLQVKQDLFDAQLGIHSVEWVTEKTINVTASGLVSEVCAE